MDSDSPERIMFSETYPLCRITLSEAKELASEELPSHKAVNLFFGDERGETTVTVESSDSRRLNRILKRFKKVFRPYIITNVNDTLEEALVKTLTHNNQTIATAESVTGGMIVSRLVNVPGVSSCLKESFVTYGDEAKIAELDVKKETIEESGVVSERVASQMAEGLRKRTAADICVATSGYAGPNGDDIGKVCYGFFVLGRLWVSTVFFDGDRNGIRKKATAHAICELIRYLKSVGKG